MSSEAPDANLAESSVDPVATQTVASTNGLSYATYRVIPDLEDDRFLRCIYIDDRNRVQDPQSINIAKHGSNFNAIRFKQFKGSKMIYENGVPIKGIRLLGAAALQIDTRTPTISAYAAEKRSVTVPVPAGHKVGVLLIFELTDQLGNSRQLISTADPEIKNGVL